MFILLIFAFLYVLNAETFYLEKRATPFYTLNVQINGNDITSNFEGNKLVIDEYIIEGPNMLSVCYTYNPGAGIPNVKQLAKVELYNTKVNTKIRGLASLTPKSLIPEYISVSPQSKKFDSEPQKCVTHNFQDYTKEQLLAMETHFNPVTDNNYQLVETAPVNNNQSLDTEPMPLEEPRVESLNPMGEIVENKNLQELDMLTQQPNNEMSQEVTDVVTSEPSELSANSNQLVENESADEALNYIPAEDFVSSNPQPTTQEPLEYQNFNDVMDTPNEMETTAQDFSPVHEAINPEDINPEGEPNNIENNNSSVVTNENNAGTITEEVSEPDNNENLNYRDVASDKENNLSDEEFFSELDLQDEGSEAK